MKKAKQGVKIYILTWDEIDVVAALGSKQAMRVLRSLHPNIYTMRDPKTMILLWTHHQKVHKNDKDNLQIVCHY